MKDKRLIFAIKYTEGSQISLGFMYEGLDTSFYL